MNRRYVWPLAAVVVVGMFVPRFLAQGPQGRPSAPGRLSAHDAQADAIIARMTLDEKVGQMTQADQESIADPADVGRLFLGSVLSGGNSDPKTNSLEDWTAMYERLQAEAVKTRLGIPILYGVDAVHGHNNVIGAVIFPHNIGLGATRNAKLVEEINRITAKEVRATGIQWTFAPCVAVPRDDRWGRTYEGFSEDPALVAELGAAAVRGLQGDNLANPLSVLACAKHYAGDGGTTFGTGIPNKALPGGHFPFDQGDTRGDEAELRRIHLAGYITAVQAGVGTIMPSYSSWNGEKISGHKRMLTDVLKGELGFEGFLISDYNAIDQVAPDFREAVKKSINAGMDMAMVPARYREFITTLKSLVEAGEVPMSRIDDAVRRILRVKIAMGLLDPERSHMADRSLHETFGSEAHRAVARQAVRESLVLLKNEGNLLPLRKNAARIHVAGRGADDLGMQCGGWTIQWQGQSGPVTRGTTVLEGIRRAVSPRTKVTYSADGSGAAGADAAVVVIGEMPYAEMMGDRFELKLDDEDVATVQAVEKAGVPMVVVLLSGRPLDLGDVLGQAEAFVAAWLPGTEGDGISDVLFGDAKPTGKLSFSWPRSSKTPVNVGDPNYDPLFPFGFGLTY
jgi:beta-glucosidase